MMNDRQRCIRGNSVAVIAAALLGACQPKPAQQEAASPHALAPSNDTKLIERAQTLRARAEAAPGGASEAADFASIVTTLYTQGVVQRQNLSAELLDAAIVCLARARQARPDDPDLLLRKGELLLAAGQQVRGVSALKESVALRPTLRAFQALGKIYAADKRTEDVVALCKRTLPAMKSDESRYAVLDSCLEFSGATAPEAGIGWASPKDFSFYKARRREVEARQSAAKQKAQDTAER